MVKAFLWEGEIIEKRIFGFFVLKCWDVEIFRVE